MEFETFNRQLNAVNRHTGSKLVNAVQQDVHAILQLGEAQIEKSARALIDAARNEADEKLSAELSRLEALRAVNPNIRDDELTAIESNRQQVMESPGSGRLASGCPAFDRCNASVTEPKMGMENYNPPQEPPGWLSCIRMTILWWSTSRAVCCLCRVVWKSTKTA